MQNNVLPAEKIYLPDGTELRLCKGIVSRTGNRKLYCSKAGRFYSLSTRGLNPNKPYVTKNFHRKPNVHSNYPRMCGWVGNPHCHILVAIAWIGPRRVDRLGRKYECHHLNGDNTDSRACNLIWLSRTAHRRFDAALKKGLILERQDPGEQMEARQDNDPSKLPENMKPEELLELFSMYNVGGDCYEGE